MLAEDQPCVSVVQQKVCIRIQKVCIRINNFFAIVSPSCRYEWQPPLSGKGVLFVHSVPAGLSHISKLDVILVWTFSAPE